jgi:hypothetical protein
VDRRSVRVRHRDAKTPEQFVADPLLEEAGSNRRYRVTPPGFRARVTSPLLNLPQPRENSERTRTETTRTQLDFSGTDGSDPVPSSGESRANLIFGRTLSMTCLVRQQVEANPTVAVLGYASQCRIALAAASVVASLPGPLSSSDGNHRRTITARNANVDRVKPGPRARFMERCAPPVDRKARPPRAALSCSCDARGNPS